MLAPCIRASQVVSSEASASPRGSQDDAISIFFATRPTDVVSFNENLRFNHPMARVNRGRPSKGDRDAFMTKPARPVGDAIREHAEQLGMTYGDYIASILARELGMPEYAPVPPHVNDEELHINKVA